MQKRVLAGGSIGQFIEFYDFTLYGLTAVIFSQLFFPGSNPVTAMLATFATFGVAFVVRPIGGLFFGALGDRIGRRRVLTITLIAIGGATALMGLLPDLRPDRCLGTGPAGPLPPHPGLLRRRRIRGSSVVCLRTRPGQAAAASGSTSRSPPPPCPPSSRVDDPHPESVHVRTKPSWRGAGACRSCWRCRWHFSASGSAAARRKATRSTRPKRPRPRNSARSGKPSAKTGSAWCRSSSSWA